MNLPLCDQFVFQRLRRAPRVYECGMRLRKPALRPAPAVHRFAGSCASAGRPDALVSLAAGMVTGEPKGRIATSKRPAISMHPKEARRILPGGQRTKRWDFVLFPIRRSEGMDRSTGPIGVLSSRANGLRCFGGGDGHGFCFHNPLA